ncbi:putative carboxylesterase 7 [Silene latifolia]|uniref:putative carboxylesterase 7 n=1 Tax=Silene latifolia TaxID=37657 RepID=UPI003D77ACBC
MEDQTKSNINRVNNPSDEIFADYSPTFRVYNDGRVDRLNATKPVSASLDSETGVESKDLIIFPETGVSVRVFNPIQIFQCSTCRKMPLIMYCHGSGFCSGSTFYPVYHNFLNRLALETQAIIVSVEYRKATEYPLPVAYDDCWDALLWIFSHDPNTYPGNKLTVFLTCVQNRVGFISGRVGSQVFTGPGWFQFAIFSGSVGLGWVGFGSGQAKQHLSGIDKQNIVPVCFIELARYLKSLKNPVKQTSRIHSTKEPWLESSKVDFSRLFLSGDSSGANVAHQVTLRAGVEINKKIVYGLILIQPFFWGKVPIGNEINCKRGQDGAALSTKLWAAARWGSPASLDDPWMNPAKDPTLSSLGCRRVLICLAQKDVLRDRGLFYGNALKKSGWLGDVKVEEIKGEDHVFHLIKPSSPKTLDLMRQIQDFVNCNNPESKL